MRRLRGITMLAAVLLAPSSFAVEKQRAERWAGELAKTSALIKGHSYATALPILQRLSSEILNQIGPSEASNFVLVVPLIQMALAEEGLGQHAVAMWHWDMAQTLYPPSAASDLSMFGDPGVVLKQNILVDPNPEKCPHHGSGPYPVVVKQVPPSYPDGARQFRASGIVTTWVKIHADGSVASPRVVKALPGPLTYAALIAVGQWKFKPLEENGQPIESDFCLTINYKLN